MPEFERLVGDLPASGATQRWRRPSPLLKIVEPAAQGAAPYPLLMALHGNNSNIARLRALLALGGRTRLAAGAAAIIAS